MRRILRYSIILTLIAGLIWVGSTVKIGHRTAFGHIGAWSMKVKVVREAIGWTKHRINKAFAEDEAPKAKPAPRAPAPQPEPAATPRRVALLERAAEEARRPERAAPAARSTPASEPAPADKTRIDERFSTRNKKALDALVSSRTNRP